MTAQPFVSVVLLNYNGMRHLERCMASLLRTQYEAWELIFVDNGSVDGSGDAFISIARPALGNRVVHVRLEQNVGYSKANNLGILRAQGEFIALVSNDIEVKPDWLVKAVQFFSNPRNEDVAVAEAYLISIHDRSTMDAMYNFIDPIGFCHPYLGPERGAEVFYSEGAVMFIKAAVLSATNGLFDSDYFMFFEDIDFCWRVRLAGFRVAVIADAQAFHVRGGTVEGVIMKTDPRYLRLNTRNRLATLYKNYNRLNLSVFFTLSLLAEVSFALAALPYRRDWTRAVMAGIGQFFVEHASWREKRRTVQESRNVPDSLIMSLMVPLPDALRTTMNDWGEVKRHKARETQPSPAEVK